MQLFFIACDVNGENFDRFISAPTAERAVEIWMRSDWVLEHEVDDAPLIVFRVPSFSPTELAHDWHESWEIRGVQSVLERK